MSQALSVAVRNRRPWPDEAKRRLVKALGNSPALYKLTTEDLWMRYLDTLGIRPRAPLVERMRAYAPEYPPRWAALKLPE